MSRVRSTNFWTIRRVLLAISTSVALLMLVAQYYTSATFQITLSNTATSFEEIQTNSNNSFLETQKQSDPAGLSLILSNDDLALSRLEADENNLSARVQYMAFPPGSTDWNDLLVLSDLRVIEYTLERERLVLECREI